MYGRSSLPTVLAGVMEYMLNLKAAAHEIDTHSSTLCTLATLVFNIILYEHPCHFIGLIRMIILIQCNIVISLLFQVEEYRTNLVMDIIMFV